MSLRRSRWSLLLTSCSVLVLGLSSASPAHAEIPGLMRVVLPGGLATRIAQEALGKPTARFDQSHVTIPIKKAIEATLPKVDLGSAPEVVRVYGNRLFGINFAQPFQLDLKIFDLVSQGDVKIKSLNFTRTTRENRILIDAELEMRQVRVSAREIWFREIGLTPDDKRPVKNVCPIPPHPMDSFRGSRVGARVLKPVVLPKSRMIGDVPVVARGRFEAEISDVGGRRIEIRPLSVQHDVTRVLSSNYELRAQLEVPPVFVKIDGECFPGDDSGIRAVFKSMLEDIKLKVVRGVEETLVQVAMKASAEAFEELRLPIEHEIVHRPKKTETSPLTLETAARVDATRVFRRVFWAPQASKPAIEDWSPGESEELSIPEYSDSSEQNFEPRTVMSSDATRVDSGAKQIVGLSPKNGKSGQTLLQKFLREVQGKLSLGAIDASRSGALILRLADELAINSVREPELVAVSEGTLPKQRVDQLRLILNRSFFESKADLIDSLKAEQNALLPNGVKIGEKGIEIFGTGENRISLVVFAEVDLDALDIPQVERWKIKAVSLLEKYTGSTGGVYRIPIQLDLVPRLETVLGMRRIVLYPELRKNLMETEFKQVSNLGDASRLIVSKLVDAAGKLKFRPVMIDLDGLESKAPLRLERFELTDQGALVIDLGLRDLRHWFKKAKDRKKARKS